MLLPFYKKRFGLLGQIILLVGAVLLLSGIMTIFLFSSIVDEIIEDATGREALTTARMVAENESIITALEEEEHPQQIIQPVTEQMRKTTGADYIVIANTSGIRQSHPHTDQIGKPTKTSNEAPLSGESIVFIDDGVLGEAVKAKIPIHNKNGEIIGVSSVGILTDEVDDQILLYQLQIAFFGGITFLAGIPGAFFIARRVKRLIFNLEPEEIAHAFSEKQAILESMNDATIAVNRDFKVLSANKRAREILGEQTIERLTEPHIVKLVQNAMQSRDEEFVQEQILLNQNIYLIDGAAIFTKEAKVSGYVLTLRPFSEVQALADELIEIQQQTAHIRAQNHEYLNKLNTLNGLLILNRFDEAKKFIKMEVNELQKTVAFLISTVKDPLIIAVLLGKVNRAKEMKVSFSFEENSQWTDWPDDIRSDYVVTIIGNLIDNAIEAAAVHKGTEAHVHVTYTDFGNDLIIDIEDNGKGMSKEEQSYFFKEGVSSKTNTASQHGLGLTIMQNALEQIGGSWYRTERKEGGTCMTIAIPKLQTHIEENNNDV